MTATADQRRRQSHASVSASCACQSADAWPPPGYERILSGVRDSRAGAGKHLPVLPEDIAEAAAQAARELAKAQADVAAAKARVRHWRHRTLLYPGKGVAVFHLGDERFVFFRAAEPTQRSKRKDER